MQSWVHAVQRMRLPKSVKLRPYQLDAKRGAYRAIKNNRAGLVAMPTGTGKTVTFADIIADVVAAGRRVLVLAHREELLDQAADKITAVAGCQVTIEQGKRKADPDSPVVIASVQSIVRRLARFPPDMFDLIIHDECHHCLASQPRKLFAHFASAKILGFTATPNRGDERALAQVFDCVAYDMTAAAAIMGGWLVPFKVETIKLKTLDLSEVRRARGQFVDADLAKAMIKSTREAVVPAVRRAGHLQTIVFCVTLDHMHTVAACVRLVAEEQRVTINVATVDGTTPKDERARIMAAFKAGEINWLCNVGVATEGFDAPGVECVVMLRPTLSRGLYIQMIGRGGRPLPGIVDGLTVDDMLVRMDQGIGGAEFGTDYSGWITRAVVALQRGDVSAARRLAIALSDKSECLVLDFAGNAGRHEVASTMDLLGGDYTLPERREAERLIALDGPDNLLDALERARLALASKTLDHLARIGDPFALFGISPRRDRYEREPTANHRRVLTPLNLPRVVDWREANDLVSEIARREDADLCTYSQAAILCRLGCPVGPVQSMSRREAAALVRMLAADQWRRPNDWGGMRETAARLDLA